MRIALNALAVDPLLPGGDATYVQQLAKHLPRIAVDDEIVVFASRRGSREFAVSAPNTRVVACPVPEGSFVVRALWEQLFLPFWLRAHNIELLHAPVNISPLAWTGRSVLTLLEAEPYIRGQRMPAALRAWWRAMRSTSARKAKSIITISEAAKTELVQWMGLNGKRVRVVHLGVDQARFSPVETERPFPRPYVLWVGRPYPRKNLPVLIEAFAGVVRGGRPEYLIVAGRRGWVDSEINEAVAAHGCEERVIRRSPIPPERLPSWFHEASAVVVPSLHEAFGLTALEAMACGVPAVVSDIPALREVAGDCAIYAKPTSARAWTTALLSVLEDRALADRLVASGLKRASQFTWETCARQTLAVYQAASSG